MIKCIKCGLEKPDEEFPFRNKALNIRQYTCKECKRKYNKTRYDSNPELRRATMERNKKQNKILKEYINSVKEHSCCQICGESRPYVLDFHHLRDKKYDIGRAAELSLSLKTLQAELNKCILVCSNCHREIHYKEKQLNKI